MRRSELDAPRRRRRRCRARASARAWRTLAKPAAGARADPVRGAVGPDQLGKARLDRRIAPAQRVVVGIGDLGRVLLVVERGRGGRSRRPAAPAPRRPRSSRQLARPAGLGCGHAARQADRAIRLSAAARAASVTVSPASMRAISSRRSAAVERHRRAVARPPADALARPASDVAPRAATCGRVGHHQHLHRSATRARRSPTAAAVAPPMPVSTSSKTSVGTGEPRPARPSAPASGATARRPRRSCASGPGGLARVGRDQEADALRAVGRPVGLGAAARPRARSAPCRA